MCAAAAAGEQTTTHTRRDDDGPSFRGGGHAYEPLLAPSPAPAPPSTDTVAVADGEALKRGEVVEFKLATWGENWTPALSPPKRARVSRSQGGELTLEMDEGSPLEIPQRELRELRRVVAIRRTRPPSRSRRPSRKPSAAGGLGRPAHAEPQRERRGAAGAQAAGAGAAAESHFVALRERGAQGLEEQPQAPPEGGRRCRGGAGTGATPHENDAGREGRPERHYCAGARARRRGKRSPRSGAARGRRTSAEVALLRRPCLPREIDAALEAKKASISYVG